MGLNDLRQDLEAVGGSLADTTADWRKRVEAIKRVKDLVLAGAANNPNFVVFAKENLKEAFNAQLKDLRSAVIREVCGCIQALCANCQPAQWEVMSDWWLAALFKCSFVTVAAVAEASNAALRFIVQAGRLSPRAAAAVFHHTQSKHSVCRTHAYECVLLMLQVHSHNFLEKHTDALEEALQSGVVDGTPEVRQLSRLMWWVFKEHFPDRADSLYQGFDPPVQRNIQDEAEAYQAMERPSSQSASVSPPKKAATPAARRSHTATPNGSTPEAPSADDADGSPREASSATKAAARKKKAIVMTRKRAASHDAALRAAVGPDDSRGDQPPSISVGTRLAPQQSPSTPTSPTAEDSDAGEASLQPTVLNLDGAAEGEADAAEAYRKSPPRTATDRSPGSSPKSGPALGGSARGGSPFPPAPAPALPEDVPAVLALAEDPLWSTRVKCLEAVAAAVRGPRQPEVTAHLEKVMTTLLGRMKDPHYKVVMAGIQSLMDLMQVYTHQLEPYYEPLFARIFSRQTDAKEAVRRLAQEAAELFGRVVQPGSRLVPSLLKVMDTNNPRVKCLCAGYLKGLLERCEDYVAHPPTMKMVAHKYLSTSMHASRTPELERTCTAALLVLHRLNPPVFVAQMSALTPSEVLEAGERLSPFISGFAEELAKHRKRGTAGLLAGPAQDVPVAAADAEEPAKAGRAVLAHPSNNGQGAGPFAPKEAQDARRRSASVPGPPSLASAAIPAKRAASPALSATTFPSAPQTSCDGDSEQPAPAPTAVQVRIVRDFVPVPLDLDSPAPEPSSFIPTPTTSAARPVIAESQDDVPISPASLHSLGKSHRSAWGYAMPTAKAYDPTLYRTVECPGGLYAPADRPAPSRRPTDASGPTEADAGPPLEALVAGLRSAVTREQRREALQALMVAAGQDGAAAAQWARQFPAVLEPTLRCAAEDDLTLQLSALLVLRQLVASHAKMCEAHLPAIFATMLQLANCAMPELSAVAEEGLAELVSGVAAPLAMAAVLETLTARPPKPEVPLRLLGPLLARLSPREVLQVAPTFMGPLYEGLRHRRAEVRKAVVFCLVDASLAVGAPFEEWLQPLNASQRKLVALYAARQQRLTTELELARQP